MDAVCYCSTGIFFILWTKHLVVFQTSASVGFNARGDELVSSYRETNEELKKWSPFSLLHSRQRYTNALTSHLPPICVKKAPKISCTAPFDRKLWGLVWDGKRRPTNISLTLVSISGRQRGPSSRQTTKECGKKMFLCYHSLDLWGGGARVKPRL